MVWRSAIIIIIIISSSSSRVAVIVVVVVGHAVTQWLGHYATSRKVAGSRPHEANEFFQFT
jgi:hypothetical protein